MGWPSQDVVDIYTSARNATLKPRLAAHGGDVNGGGSSVSFLSRGLGETIDKESSLMLRVYLQGHPPVPDANVATRRELARHRPRELLQFCAERKQEGRGGWSAALADPVAEAAMQQLRRRVKQISSGSSAFEESLWANHMINGQDGSAAGPTQAQRICSVRNPLSYDVLRDRYPASSHPRITPLPPPKLPPQPTSLWNPGWGACADEQVVNLNFKQGIGAERSRIGATGSSAWMPPGRIRRKE